MVYLCNPNNPTATINSGREIKDFVAEVRKTSPTTAILFDEAYADYATDKGFEARSGSPCRRRMFSSPRPSRKHTGWPAFGLATSSRRLKPTGR